MLKAIIIDDEPKGRQALRQKLLEYCPQVQLLAEAASGLEGIQVIGQYRPDLVFLDIEMPNMSGFDMLNKIGEKHFHVIFTTAYDQYAIKAIRYAAFDYLLKPVDIEELKTAVGNIAALPAADTPKQVALLQQNMQQPKKHLHKLAIPTSDSLLFFDINTIIYLEASSNYTNIYFTDGTKIIASRTLKDFEELLPGEVFFRPHHSYIINLNFIKRYIRGDGGQVEMQNGSYIDVSRRKKEDFLKTIGS